MIINLVKSLSKWKILSNLAFFFHSVYKTYIDCFLFGAQFKIIGPRWCQNHDYALSFASGIVMVTSPRAYNFNCAPQSSQYLYNMQKILNSELMVHNTQGKIYYYPMDYEPAFSCDLSWKLPHKKLLQYLVALSHTITAATEFCQRALSRFSLTYYLFLYFQF